MCIGDIKVYGKCVERVPFLGYCNSWEHAGSSSGPRVNPAGKPLLGITSGKTYPGNYLWEILSGTGVKLFGKNSPGNYFREKCPGVTFPGNERPQRSNAKIVFWPHCYLALRSRSKVRIKVKGRGQGHGSRSKSNFWREAVDIRGSALPSAAKSKGESSSVKGICLCVE